MMDLRKWWNKQKIFQSVLQIILLFVLIEIVNCLKNETTDAGVAKTGPHDKASNHLNETRPSRNNSSANQDHSTKIVEKDLSFILDDQDGYRICDPRVFFTGERLATAFSMIETSMDHMNDSLKLAYLLRATIELGRKIVSRWPQIMHEASSVFTHAAEKSSIDPSNLARILMEILDNANESPIASPFALKAGLASQSSVRQEDDHVVLNTTDLTMTIIGRELASWLGDLSDKNKEFINKSSSSPTIFVARLLDAFSLGLRDILNQAGKHSTVPVIADIFPYSERAQKNLLRRVYFGLKEGLDDKYKGKESSGDGKTYKQLGGKVNLVRGFVEPNKLVGPLPDNVPWNHYLFMNLTSPERLIKVVSGILRRLRGETKQNELIGEHLQTIIHQFQRLLNSYITRLLLPKNNDGSGSGNSSVSSPKSKLGDQAEFENKVPALCFVIGSRWRLILSRGPTTQIRDKIINNLVKELNKARQPLNSIVGKRLCTLCLPRLEAGWRGLTIHGGEKTRDSSAVSEIDSWMDLKDILGDNPIQFGDIKNPFAAGAAMGFDLGSKIGFNAARNATLEMERPDKADGEEKQQRVGAKAGMMEGAKSAFYAAINEGYKVGLRMSPNAGVIITRRAAAEAGRAIGITLGGNIGGVAGRSAGAKDANIADEDTEESNRLLQYAQSAGEQAGSETGAIVGASAAIMAASDAYVRLVLSRGKLTNIRFFFNEYIAGASEGFKAGLMGGAIAADSVTLKQTAPTSLKIVIPKEADIEQLGEFENSGDESMVPMPQSLLDKLETRRDLHSGQKEFKGSVKIKIGPAYETFELAINAYGYEANNTIYTTLNGTASGKGRLAGFVFADLLPNEQKAGSTTPAPSSTIAPKASTKAPEASTKAPKA